MTRCLCVPASPIAHVVKVLCELSQVWTLLFILLFGPKQHLWDLEGGAGFDRGSSSAAERKTNQKITESTLPRSYRRARRPGA